MAKKKKIAPTVRKTTKKAFEKPYFMGLTKSQTKSLAVGIIIVGFGLFILAGYTYKNRQTLTTSILPSAAMTTAAPTPNSSPSTQTPTPAAMAQKPPVTVLPNTSSKVTYTVRDGDSLATIGETLCKSDRAWLSIANTNQITYPYVINPGETYIITCN